VLCGTRPEKVAGPANDLGGNDRHLKYQCDCQQGHHDDHR
jgi:hypothetical protein